MVIFWRISTNDVSQDKKFVDNLSCMQHLMINKWGNVSEYAKVLFLEFSEYYFWELKPQTLEDDVSSFKVTLTSCQHEKMVNRVLDSLICITWCAMEHLACDVQINMWHLAHNYKKKWTMK